MPCPRSLEHTFFAANRKSETNFQSLRGNREDHTNRRWSTQPHAALIWRAAANGHAKLTRFQNSIPVIIHHFHHLWGYSERDGSTLAGFEMDSPKADQAVQRHNCRGFQVAQVDLGDFFRFHRAAVGQGTVERQRFARWIVLLSSARSL